MESHCAAGQGILPASGGNQNPSPTTVQPTNSGQEGTSQSPGVSHQTEPPAPIWAIQLSQSLASLQGLPAIADHLGKALAKLSHKSSKKRKRPDEQKSDMASLAHSDDSSLDQASSQSEGELPPSEDSSGEEDENIDESKDRDIPHDIDGLIKGVLELLNISQTQKQQGETSRLFKRQHKSTNCFPSHEQLLDIIQ